MKTIAILLVAGALLLAGCSAPEEESNPNEVIDGENGDGGGSSVSGWVNVRGNGTSNGTANETATNGTATDG